MRILGIAVLLVLVLAGSPVFASIVADTTAYRTTPGALTLINLSGATPGPVDILTALYGIDFDPGTDGDTGVVMGSLGGKYAAPYVNSAGDAWQTEYLSSGDGGSSIKIHFTNPQSAISFLWGSVDAYNKIVFAGGEFYTGTQAATAAGAIADGNQFEDGSVYVAITPGAMFTDVTIISDPSYSFELADIRATTTSFGVPDGGVTLMLLGAALVGLETLRRKLRASDSPRPRPAHSFIWFGECSA